MDRLILRPIDGVISPVPLLKLRQACPHIITMQLVTRIFTIWKASQKYCFKKYIYITWEQNANTDTDDAAAVLTLPQFLQPHPTLYLLFALIFPPAVLHFVPLLLSPHPSVFLKLPQQFQSSVWTTWKRTTTQFPGCQCLALLVPPHSPHALAALAPQPAGRQAPCCRTVLGRTAGTMGPGPPRGVQERLWLAATPALSSCPRLPRTRPPWMTARGPSPVPQNPVMPCSGRDTLLHPTHPQLETALPGALPMPSGPSPIERNFYERKDD